GAVAPDGADAPPRAARRTGGRTGRRSPGRRARVCAGARGHRRCGAGSGRAAGAVAMPEISAKEVQRLRQSTGVGMMDAKKALVENDGEFEKAINWLREHGLSKAADRGGRENVQGAVATYVSGNVGAIVELKCETDF